jgi:hypothetical protein
MRVLLFAVVFLSGCATLVNGTRQDIRIVSEPAGAKVFVDGELVGESPVTVAMTRDEYHTVEIQKDGYETFDETIGRSWSPWFLGNLFPCLPCSLAVFGAVDYFAGSAYELSPTRIEAQLEAKQ